MAVSWILVLGEILLDSHHLLSTVASVTYERIPKGESNEDRNQSKDHVSAHNVLVARDVFELRSKLSPATCSRWPDARNSCAEGIQNLSSNRASQTFA